MIKSADPRSGSGPECYTASNGGKSPPGIIFEKADGTCRYLPYSLLSAVDFNSRDELSFRFDSSSIVVHGKNLRPIWMATCENELEGVREIEGPDLAGIGNTPWVREIVFSDGDNRTGSDSLPFPNES